ncbi:conserved hypothetical protein [Magnetospirillum sp. LM-5]|uniref:hypothetical protein n=1 Tax=Magnetospirillum sp. LM-5 TaxID=2681466 RepID=UPI0013842961|nr:hypothetical protein [Magnetospirillum sp. LM-5]CAA7624740.1 conserved hypothetical protein [Magnetospirillum sp. LM-5]
MRGWVVALTVLSLSACYQVQVPVVDKGVRAPGVADGTWRRDDGTEVGLSWDEAAQAYRVSAGGVVRLAPAANGLYVADYQAERRIVLLLRASPRELVFLAPPEPVEKGLAAVHGAAIKAGPIKLLNGDVQAVAATLGAMAARPDLAEAGRLTRVGP